MLIMWHHQHVTLFLLGLYSLKLPATYGTFIFSCPKSTITNLSQSNCWNVYPHLWILWCEKWGVKTWFEGKKWVWNRSEPCHTGETHSHRVQSYPLPIEALKSYYSPSPSPDCTRPINTSQSPVTDGCRGQQGLGGVERGFAKVRLGHRGCLRLLWHGLSISVQVDK